MKTQHNPPPKKVDLLEPTNQQTQYPPGGEEKVIGSGSILSGVQLRQKAKWRLAQEICFFTPQSRVSFSLFLAGLHLLTEPTLWDLITYSLPTLLLQGALEIQSCHLRRLRIMN